MPDIIKTWPCSMERRRVIEAFTHDWGTFYFTLGRGKPSRKIDRLYWTHGGRILGHFNISDMVRNEGQLPRLRSISGETSEWQIKPDNWVAICNPPFARLRFTVYYSGFRGWRYFDLAAYRKTLDAKVEF